MLECRLRKFGWLLDADVWELCGGRKQSSQMKRIVVREAMQFEDPPILQALPEVDALHLLVYEFILRKRLDLQWEIQGT